MKNVKLYFVLVFLCAANCSFAKGHGGGHGGGHHSGGHGHSNGGHSTARSAAPANNAARKTANRTTAGSTASRTTAGSAPVTHLSGPRSNVGSYHPAGAGNAGYAARNGYYYPHEYYNSYPYYYYGYSPYYYNPYFGMWSMGAGFMYAPSYSSAPSQGNNYGPENNGPLDGFVVYEHDTLSGDITIKQNSISLETSDSARGYDYVFKIKKTGLECVTVYNDDNKQLNLVRLKNDPKKLMRVVHIGKLNIYDARHGFIYRPEDIDIKSLSVVYNGQDASLHSSSVNETKMWLTDYVNRAYGLNLKAKDFNWNALLIYVDKLD